MFSELLIEPTKDNLRALFYLWIFLLGILLCSQWASKRAVGLPLAYAFGLSIIHVFGAYIYSLPHYTPRSDTLLQNQSSLLFTHAGFRAATMGLFGFTLGCLSTPMVFRKNPARKLTYNEPQVTTKLPVTLLLLSLLSFFIMGPILRRIPSFGSLANSGAAISVVAVLLFSWLAFIQGNKKRFLLGLTMTGAFPFITIVFMGFASMGTAAAGAIWMMILRFYRPRIISLIFLPLFIFSSLTLYVNWMLERESVRSAVWGNTALSNRVDRFLEIFENFKLFSINSQVHLELIDGRLNQNDLAGKAVTRLDKGRVEYAHGFTLYVAAISWVPRILWPGKPATGGSGGVVAHFTGQKFAEGTSIGAGQVLEFYANFGMAGEFWLYFIFGFILRLFDLRAGFYLSHGDLWTCARYMLPGLGMLQPGGLLAEVVGTTAANAVFVFLLHHYVFKKYYETSPVSPGRMISSQPRGV